ncbi:Putative ribonuclease H protein At1g65750 [Linum perenne]
MGRPLAVFAANLGACSITRAELRAADIGLRIAWDLGYRRAHLQLDSMVAVGAISNQQTNVTRHVYREGNKVADRFALLGHSLNFGTFINCLYPPDIDKIIWDDYIGACFPRLIIPNE